MRFAFRRHIDGRLSSDLVGCAAFALALAAYVLRRLFWLQSEMPAYPGATWDIACVVFALIALLISVYALRAERWWGLRTAIVGASLGMIYFVATLGMGLADPTNVDWLMRGDWATHFLGWHFFRSALWAWPLGAFDAFWYPIGTSVVYTDSLPLVAIPLKLFNAVLPARFQYIGIWILLNCILQGIFGALLMRCFTRHVSVQAVGAAFLLVTPVFIARAAQDTLTTQWLILACLWMYFRQGDARRAIFPWLVLGSISALVHPYLCVMVLSLMVAYYARAFFDRTLGWKEVFIPIAVVVISVGLCWWIAGAFIIKVRSGFEAGVYSANLLTWINAESFSRWLPALPQIGDGQFEGVGYLGLGVLVLCVLSIGLSLAVRRRDAAPRHALAPLVVAVALMTLFAFSTRLTLGSWVLVDVTPKHLPVLGALRGCGRFIWPSVYLITLFSVVAVARRADRFTFPILVVAFFIQLLDLAPLQIFHAHMREGTFAREHEPMLHDAYWNDTIRGKRHVVLFPASNCGVEAAPYFPFSLLAADNGMTINTGYLARFDGIRRTKYCEDLSRDLDAGIRDSETLYIVRPDLLAHFQTTSTSPLDCREIEGYASCIVSKQPESR